MTTRCSRLLREKRWLVSYNPFRNNLVQQDPKDLRDHQDRLVHKDHRDLRVGLALRDLRVGQALRVLRDLREGEDLRGLKDHRGHRGLREGKAQIALQVRLVEVEANLQEGIVRRHLHLLSNETMAGTLLQLERLQCQ